MYRDLGDIEAQQRFESNVAMGPNIDIEFDNAHDRRKLERLGANLPWK